jgi:hypothetical protein
VVISRLHRDQVCGYRAFWRRTYTFSCVSRPSGTQNAVARVSCQSTRHRLTSRQPCAAGYKARHQMPPFWSPATK